MYLSDRRLFCGMLLCAIFAMACAQTHKVVPVSSALKGDYVYYALPRAVISVTAVVSFSSVDPNAPCIGKPEMKDLGLKAPKIEKGSFMTLHKVGLSKKTEADPEAQFAVDLDGTGAAELGLTMNVQGALTKGSSDSTDIVVPLAVGATEVAASISGTVLFGAPAASLPQDYCESAKVALETVREEIRDLYSSIGAADPKEVLEFKAANLTAIAKALEYPFTGVKVGESKEIVCDIVPKKEGRIGIFTWSQDGGIAWSTTNCYVPAGLVIANDKAVSRKDSKGNPLLPSLGVQHRVELAIEKVKTDVSSIALTTKKCDRSFYYRVPAFANVVAEDSLSGGQAKRVSPSVQWAIPQLGKVHSLPRMTSTGTTRAVVSLDAETGALLEATAKTTEADFGTSATSMGTGVKGFLDARNAAAARDAELESLKREQAVLEARVAIDAAKAALGE